MSLRLPLLMAAASVWLSACALPPRPSLPAEPAPLVVSVDGQSYRLSPLTASTWTATATGLARPLANNSTGKAALLREIENASGCKVTDSDFSRQGMQLDAQVDCGSQLKN